MDTDIWRFQWACISGDNPRTPFFAAENIAAADAGRSNSLFGVYYQGQWYSYQTTPDWSAIAMAALWLVPRSMSGIPPRKGFTKTRIRSRRT